MELRSKVLKDSHEGSEIYEVIGINWITGIVLLGDKDGFIMSVLELMLLK